MALALVDFAEAVENIFLGVVHHGDLFGGFGERADGEVEHAFGDVALGEEVHRAGADVGVGAGFLEFGDGLGGMSGEEELFAILEAGLQVGGVAFHAFFGLGDKHFGFLLLEVSEFFGEARGFLVVWGGGEELLAFRNGLVEDFETEVGSLPQEHGVGVVGQTGGVLVPLLGTGQITFLLEKAGEFAGHIEALWVGLVLGTEFGDLLVEHLLAFDNAGFLFEGHCLVFVFDEVAVVFGAFGMVDFLPAAVFYGLAGGGVFLFFRGNEVGRIEFDGLAEDGDGSCGLVNIEVALAEVVEVLGFFGVPFDDGFEGERGGFFHAEGQGGVAKEMVGLNVEGVALEFLFGHFESCLGIFLEGGRPFEGDGAEAGEQRLFAFGIGGGLAEEASAIEELRFLLEDGLDEGEGVSEVADFDRVGGFEPEGALVRGQFFLGLDWHRKGECCVAGRTGRRELAIWGRTRRLWPSRVWLRRGI